MTFLGRFRRGQIRGIDFSLAMIIFLLTMAQVLTLTGTFIENAQTSQGVNSDLSTTEAYGNQLLNNPGYLLGSGNLDWYTQTTTTLTSTGWNFGLSNGNGTVDPFKMGRLANNSESTYQLTYDQISDATSLDRTFEIRFKSTIEVKITSVIALASSFSIEGLVTLYGSPLGTVGVNLFVSDAGSTNTGYTRTNSSGYFTSTITGNPGDAGADMIVAIAQFAQGHFDVDYTFSDDAIPTQTGISLTGEDLSSGYGITIATDVGTPTYSAYYTGNVVSNVTTSGTNTMQVPDEGIVVVVARNGNSIAITTFPIIIDDYLHSPLVAADPVGTETTAIDQVILIRGVLIRYSFITWS